MAQPRVFKDGTQWCVLQEGVAGFGRTMDEAWNDFFVARRDHEERLVRRIEEYMLRRGLLETVDGACDADAADDADVEDLCHHIEEQAARAAPGRVRVEFDRSE